MPDAESPSQIRIRLLHAKLDSLVERIERSQVLCEILYGQLERHRKELGDAHAYIDEVSKENSSVPASPDPATMKERG